MLAAACKAAEGSKGIGEVTHLNQLVVGKILHALF